MMSGKILEDTVGPEILLLGNIDSLTFFPMTSLHVCLFPILLPKYSLNYCELSEIIHVCVSMQCLAQHLIHRRSSDTLIAKCH